ncbi:nucleotide sugar dehydrogenase [Silanimonas sp.]|uniref:nucleotide sugar dehydrogenase n=1 Tax=Silanimonas sp. TaxID=1929290 RepID=UPI001BC36FBF|nr:nucleotide sugar dehydrogenase [Silanimonas sp.]MBS3896687.1 nucleotide sugar dehydrogenase [Silanimonas sp.]MBS3924548.1 nucleotide sugar dehydrogenase [Xanthomonadaceae bacterium]
MSGQDEGPVAVIGLGYVGLPLAVAFGAVLPTRGFDIDGQRIAELRAGHDRTGEVSGPEWQSATRLGFCEHAENLADCRVFIVTVPTPVDAARRPDFGPLLAASRTVGQVLKPGDLVIYESTVYPGATEEICVPALEAASGLRLHTDFAVGYSPERLNPGDRQRRLKDIVKVTAGSCPAAAARVDALYRRIVTAGTHPAPSLRVAEAAKVIENTQRDLNIALMNELAMLCHRLGLDTLDVLAAAGSKWNFLPFRPGLVGGHCIGVDPYYLTDKAQQVGYHPEVILAGRRINDGMGAFVAQRVVKLLGQRGLPVHGGRVLVLGLAFKEDCPDLRNTRVIDVVRELVDYGLAVDVHDPCVAAADAGREYGLALLDQAPQPGRYEAVVVAVAHRAFRELGADAIRAFARPEGVVFDVKGILPRDSVDGRL